MELTNNIIKYFTPCIIIIFINDSLDFFKL